MTRFYVIRHGETDWNVEGLLQGHKDIPLNDNGREQARLAHKLISTIHFDHIACSPLGRCRETAEIAFAGRDLPTTYHDDLKERSFGPHEGRLRTDVVSDEHPLPDMEGMEKLADLEHRVHSCVQNLLEEHHGKTLCFVTHGGSISALINRLIGVRLRSPANAQLMALDYDATNQTWHLIETDNIKGS